MSLSATAKHPNSGARRLIVGLGRTGLSCARYLQSQGLEFAITDSRAAPPELSNLRALAPNATLSLGKFDLGLLDGVSEIVASPGVSLREPILAAAAERDLPIVGDIELFARAARAPVLAITGTNGKSTVTTLVALMAQAAGLRALPGGNLGRPALDLLREPSPDLYVLELSSFQLETTHSLRTRAATVLNVTSDHMDRYDSMLDYAHAKARIFDHCDTAVINRDDALVAAMPRHSQRVLSFSTAPGSVADFTAEVRGRDILLLHQSKPLVALSELKISGLHNAANALAALAMGHALELNLNACLRALREFSGLPHRAQWIADIAGVRYIDDSKGTNVGATLAAVSGMQAPLVVIAGGQGKGQDFAPLAQAFRGKVKHTVLLGQDAPHIAAVLKSVCGLETVQSMEQAVQAAARAASAGDVVLLSPACASLDMFRDYAHRGDVFAAAVRGLAA